MLTKIQLLRNHVHACKTGILKVNGVELEWINHQMIEFVAWTNTQSTSCSCRFLGVIDQKDWYQVESIPVKVKFLDRETNAYFLVNAHIKRPAMESDKIVSGSLLDLHIKGIRMYRMKNYGNAIRILEPQL